MPSIISPQPSSSTKAHALSKAKAAKFGSMSFSNLDELSVLNPKFLELTLMLVPSKLADSNTISVVSSLTPEFNPPIIPAKATISSPSFMQRTSEFNSLSISSKVTNLSPSLALSTTMLEDFNSLLSKACIG